MKRVSVIIVIAAVTHSSAANIMMCNFGQLQLKRHNSFPVQTRRPVLIEDLREAIRVAHGDAVIQTRGGYMCHLGLELTICVQASEFSLASRIKCLCVGEWA